MISFHWADVELCPCGCGAVSLFDTWRWTEWSPKRNRYQLGASVRLGPLLVTVTSPIAYRLQRRFGHLAGGHA